MITIYCFFFVYRLFLLSTSHLLDFFFVFFVFGYTYLQYEHLRLTYATPYLDDLDDVGGETLLLLLMMMLLFL